MIWGSNCISRYRVSRAWNSRCSPKRKKAPVALQRAINSTITQVSKMVAKEAKEKYIIKQPEVKKTLKLKKRPGGTLLALYHRAIIRKHACMALR